MRTIYVASPFRGNVLKRIRNIRYAQKISRLMWDHGYFPITPHLLYPRFLSETEENRRRVLEGLLEICEELWVFTDYGVSEGMLEEIEAFRKAGKPVVLVRLHDFYL